MCSGCFGGFIFRYALHGIWGTPYFTSRGPSQLCSLEYSPLLIGTMCTRLSGIIYGAKQSLKSGNRARYEIASPFPARSLAFSPAEPHFHVAEKYLYLTVELLRCSRPV